MEQKPTPLFIQKSFFRPVCNAEEIERVFNVQTPQDYLLKLRAETIVDNMRLFRVYRNKALRQERSWSLESSFSTTHYSNFLNALKDNKSKENCELITAGNIFSTEPNGFAFHTEYGPIITICDSLRFFLKFMHLGLLDFGGAIPDYVAVNSMRIALRVMLQTEALDFFMDPRGILPKQRVDQIHEPIKYQLQFIAGHEYAHHILGHVPEHSSSKRPVIRAMFKSQDDYGLEKIYSYAQQQEFEADIQSIMLCEYGNLEKQKVFEAALLWFACLDVYELVADIISPSSKISNHPPARDRFNNLLENVTLTKPHNYAKWQKLLNRVDACKQFFIDDVGFNIELYEFYGSLYFDKPNTKWRGKELIDRKDYY